MSLIDRRFFMSSFAAASMATMSSAQVLDGQEGAVAVRSQASASGEAIFNVKGYGATGNKVDDASPAIQKAIDACGAAGGGVVYVPPGEYTSGGLKLRSHMRFYLEAGATLFASEDPKAYPLINVSFAGHSDAPSTAALFQGDGLEDVSIEGRGIVDGQAKYVWRPDDTEHAFNHKELMLSLGKSIMRSYPVGLPERQIYPHLVWLRGCKNVRISGLSFLRSPSWTFYLLECERVVVDGIYAYTSLKEAVWADGIDMNGCKDVHISNCTIETG
ncbi:MAG: glycoside hydrolase family 28 protein, partial [Candidatus Dormibacteraceae bacterium]